MLQTEIGTRKGLVKLQHDCFAHDVYSEKQLRKVSFYDVQLVQKIATPAIQALLLFPSSRLCKSTFSMLVEIKVELRKTTRT